MPIFLPFQDRAPLRLRFFRCPAFAARRRPSYHAGFSPFIASLSFSPMPPLLAISLSFTLHLCHYYAGYASAMAATPPQMISADYAIADY